MKNNTKRLVLMGMFIALSFVGSYIKIPSPLQSIALDSMPAFLCGLIIGGFEGGLVGFLGHILTSANSGFPLSLPIHLVIGLIMFIAVFLYSYIYRKTNLYLAIVVGVILNGVVSPLVLTLFPQFGWGFFMAITPFLLLASLVNIIIAAFVFSPLKRSLLTKNKGFDMLEK